MTASVHVLETRPLEVQRSVIETLEDALKLAREGKIIAVAIAEVHEDKAIGRAWSKCDVLPELIGAATTLMWALARQSADR